MISFIKVMCSSALLFAGIFVGVVGQASDALPEVDPAKHGMSAEQLVALDALAERYVEEGRVAGMVNIVLGNGEVVYARRQVVAPWMAGYRSTHRICSVFTP